MSHAARSCPSFARVLVTVLAVLLAATPAATAATATTTGGLLEPPPQVTVPDVPVGWPAPPAATAKSLLLVDRDTGQVLAARAPDVRRPVASTIKILTALTVLRRAEPDDVVTVGDEVLGLEGASVGLDPGEQWTVGQLLDGLIARSGNDAAMALAAHVGGDVDRFVTLMREDAASLGIEGAVIATPSGLDDVNRLSARDLATVARAAMRDERFRALAARRTVDLPGIGGVATRNELLGSYPGATGIKTGYTDEAGYCLVGAATRAGHELIAVVLGSRTPQARFAETALLLDHGYDHFEVAEHGVDLRLRQAGRWVGVGSDPLPLYVPEGTEVEMAGQPVPVEVPAVGEAGTVRLQWRDELLASLDLRVEVPARDSAVGGAALGRWLGDRGYAALRAAVRDGGLAP